ncbi:hypothetical protein C8R44DRAFT_618564 [Mycena epipterygia]|nr:hypothetical protein C8R44DRAFT_618564 [Mycena epipterygia]
MALPKDIPTLCAKGTGNETRPDNVFCSHDFLDFFTSCNAYPLRVPGTTDHYPIISEIDLVPLVKTVEEQWNWRAGDWVELRKMLAEELAALGVVDGYASVEEVVAAIDALDTVIWRCVAKHIPHSKMCPHSKRWWEKSFMDQKKERNKLA